MKNQVLVVSFLIICLNIQKARPADPSVHDKKQDESIAFLLAEVEKLNGQVNRLLSGRIGLKVTRVLNGTIERKLVDHTDHVVSVAVLPDQSIASGDLAGEIILWNSFSGLIIRKLKGHSATVRSLVSIPDGRLISGSADTTIIIWNPSTGQSIKTLKNHTDKVKCLALVGEKLASGSKDLSVRIWDVNSGQQLNILKGHKDTIISLAALEDNRLASGDEDDTIKIWNLNTGELIKSFANKNTGGGSILGFLSYDVYSLVALPNYRLATGADDNDIRIWSTQNFTRINTLKGHSGTVESLRLMNDGQTLASASKDHTIKMWNINTGKLISTFKGHSSNVMSLAILDDGRLISGSEDKTIIIWV